MGDYIDGDVTRLKRRRTSAPRRRILPEDNAAAPLVDCDRYAARLTAAACVARYERRTAGVIYNGADLGVTAYGTCAGCAQGAEREANA